ncbi:hypothetical protein CALCODRAFT_161412 [Calocera cornea HHB12733]|uniref:Uncharacterized protein n=1 Tax=Calocera cornea HHB12733 TaxID=1353952 RepID=A0A165CJV0_9BASI|nr:hypothetical protein CALCODRAFT_161412 [Calocera cornea HHB12733]
MRLPRARKKKSLRKAPPLGVYEACVTTSIFYRKKCLFRGQILDQFCDIITGNVAEKVAVVRSDAHIACAQIVAHSKADLTVLHTQKRAQMDAVLCVKMQYLNYIKEVSNAHAALHDKNVALMTALKNTITTHDNNSLAGRLPAKLFS